jgi:hypothetical protein
VAAGVLGGAIGIALGYPATTFLYVGFRSVRNPTFAPALATETPYVALAGALLLGALGAFIGVLAARVATRA